MHNYKDNNYDTSDLESHRHVKLELFLEVRVVDGQLDVLVSGGHHVHLLMNKLEIHLDKHSNLS